MSSSDRRRAGLLAAWILLLLVAIAGLNRAGIGALAVPSLLDAGSWPAWARQRDAITIVFALVRALTLATAWYLLGVSVLGIAVRLLGSARLRSAADLFTVPVVRRVLQVAIGAGFATASLAAGSGNGMAAPPRPPTVAAATAVAAEGNVEMVPDTQRSAAMRPLAPPLAPPGAPAADEPGRTFVIRPGDHFWALAEQTLAQAWNRQPIDAETADYWRDLVAINRSQLPDPANPDYVLPGMRVQLPPVPPAK